MMLSAEAPFRMPEQGPGQLPWDLAEARGLSPSKPNTDYTPVRVPNGKKLAYELVNGVKVFHLVAEEIEWEVAEGLKVNAWGYNGSFPGPVIEAAEGDRVRIFVSNHLPVPTSVHWHGLIIPCGMDGVYPVTQEGIPPGDTFVYEFTLTDPGTFMYHSHFDPMTQEGMGLVGMFVVHERERDLQRRPDRDYVLLLHEWSIPIGTARPDPNEMADFNALTMNGKVAPDTEPLLAELGERIWVRFGNLSAMDHHPIHLHGYRFKVIGTDGGWAEDKSVLLPETTVLVPVGATRVIEFLANNPGDWIFHCHMTHHTMNQMGHELPNMMGVESHDLDGRIRELIPGFMSMGAGGMGDMAGMRMQQPPNSIAMKGLHGQFGPSVLGGMASVLKVRESLKGDQDPGWYSFPDGQHVRRARKDELESLSY
jgi:FtsP/CotA-like multicopper oxidase with cupredoxin domain